MELSLGEPDRAGSLFALYYHCKAEAGKRNRAGRPHSVRSRSVANPLLPFFQTTPHISANLHLAILSQVTGLYHRSRRDLRGSRFNSRFSGSKRNAGMIILRFVRVLTRPNDSISEANHALRARQTQSSGNETYQNPPGDPYTLDLADAPDTHRGTRSTGGPWTVRAVLTARVTISQGRRTVPHPGGNVRLSGARTRFGR